MSDCKIDFDFEGTDVFEEDEESLSYPGVRTVYRKEIVEGWVTTTKGEVLKRIGHGSEGRWNCQDFQGNTCYFEWYTEQRCEEASINLWGTDEDKEISLFVTAPIGFSEEKLFSLLQAAHVDPAAFGARPGSKTLKELADESKRGDSSFVMEPDGRVLRVVDVVLLKLTKADGNEILVQTDEAPTADPDDKKVLSRLPGHKLRPADNEFLVAQNILRKTLNVHEICVNLDADNVDLIVQAKISNSYPGLLTLYRQHVVSGEVIIPKSPDEATPVSPGGV